MPADDPAAAGRVASGGSSGDWEVLDGLQADEEVLLLASRLEWPKKQPMVPSLDVSIPLSTDTLFVALLNAD